MCSASFLQHHVVFAPGPCCSGLKVLGQQQSLETEHRGVPRPHQGYHLREKRTQNGTKPPPAGQGAATPTPSGGQSDHPASPSPQREMPAAPRGSSSSGAPCPSEALLLLMSLHFVPSTEVPLRPETLLLALCRDRNQSTDIHVRPQSIPAGMLGTWPVPSHWTNPIWVKFQRFVEQGRQN